MRNSYLSLIAGLGLLIIAAAVLIPILSGGFPESNLYKWLYSSGALLTLVAALFTSAPVGASLKQRRWLRIESWSAIFFCAAAVFMWLPDAAPRDWLAFTLAAAVIRIIVFFRTIRGFNKN